MVTACDQVVFEEPQPRKVKALQEFPGELHGVYLDDNDDSLIVREGSFWYKQESANSVGSKLKILVACEESQAVTVEWGGQP